MILCVGSLSLSLKFLLVFFNMYTYFHHVLGFILSTLLICNEVFLLYLFLES